MTTRSSDFGPLARTYDDLRAADGLWRETIDLLLREGALSRRRVLDVGCGTGRLATTLALDHGCSVVGVDVSNEMLDVARARIPADVVLKLGAAEALPFADASFERVTMTLVVHHVDRTRAFPEIRRVLAEAGRFAFLTFDPAHFAGYYLNRYFPSFLEIDTGRFAPRDVLEADLLDAGFRGCRCSRHRQHRTITREDALRKIRGKHISTFQLISDMEYAEGLERAERELPPEVAYDYRWLVIVADV